MPLIKSKSKKAFQENFKSEMEAGKPKDQSLAIAYSVQRKNKRKKMADGGAISAADEKRPMPDDQHNDKHMDSRASQKPIKQGQWDDDTYSEQASRSFSKAPGEADADFVSDDHANADNAVTPEEMRMIREHRKRMAMGGAVPSAPNKSFSPFENEENEDDAIRMNDEEHDREALARGGEVSPQDEIDEEKHASVAAAIMAKRKRMADGGMVDLEKNSEEDLNNEDQMSFDAGLKEQYDLRQLSKQPIDSNEHSDDIDSDEHDMVSSIRKKMASKRR